MVRPFASDTSRRGTATALAALTVVVSMSLPLAAQTTVSEKARPTAPSVAYGVMGAAQQGAFRVVGSAEYEQATGGAAGAWLNVPLGRFFSLEPQVQYLALPSRQITGVRRNAFLTDVSVRYISAPLLFKVHLKWVALTLGGQLDLPISVVDDPNLWSLESVAAVSAAATAGLELFPRSRLSLFGRYSYGLTNVDGRTAKDTANSFYNQGIQAGLRIRVFGGKRRSATTAPAPVASRPAAAALLQPAPAVSPAPPAAAPTSAVTRQAPTSVKPDSVADECIVRTGADRPTRCPVLDSDGDGLVDRIDRCPLVAGQLAHEGCPPPDTDGDGIVDEKDACPKVAGLAKYAGCGPPDTDRDGIIDDEDRCPTALGARENMGCPKITSFAANAVTFARASATLTPEGKRELDKVVDYMKLYVDVRVRLSGHTDNQSSDATNNPLSFRRAEAARDYLISRSIDPSRVTAEGHGSAQPTIGNGTPEGRAMNRRVEVILR